MVKNEAFVICMLKLHKYVICITIVEKRKGYCCCALLTHKYKKKIQVPGAHMSYFHCLYPDPAITRLWKIQYILSLNKSLDKKGNASALWCDF